MQAGAYQTVATGTTGATGMIEQEQPEWNPETQSYDYHPVGLLNDPPLPTSKEGAKALWQNNDQLRKEHDRPPHPDELWDRYVHTIAKDGYWHAFEILIFGFEFKLYCWNGQGGYGFWMDTTENQHRAIYNLFESMENVK